MSKDGIPMDEWLAELQRLSAKNDEGLTSREWGKAMGVGEDCALRRLRMAKEAGWLRVGRRRIIAIDGRPSMTIVYQVVKPQGGKR